jgi:hypothetical protein
VLEPEHTSEHQAGKVEEVNQMRPDAVRRDQATGPPIQMDPAGDCQEQAARLDRDNPQWLVLWGTFSREFVAFPLFLVPAGTVLHSESSPELVRRMRQTEQIYGGYHDA